MVSKNVVCGRKYEYDVCRKCGLEFPRLIEKALLLLKPKRSGDTSVSSGMMTFLLQAQQRPEKNGYVAQTFIEANG